MWPRTVAGVAAVVAGIGAFVVLTPYGCDDSSDGVCSYDPGFSSVTTTLLVAGFVGLLAFMLAERLADR